MAVEHPASSPVVSPTTPKADEARFLRSLRPRDWGGWKVEDFSEYHPLGRALLPNFPDEVLEDWIHRHYGDAINDYGWIGFRGLSFERCVWSTNRILDEVRSWAEHDLTANWAKQFRDSIQFRRTPLGAYMIEHGTWPLPIIVIENATGLTRPDGLALASPLHLMEGHHRFGYLRAMRDDDRWKPREAHALWIVRYDPKQVLDYWPMNYENAD